MSNISVSCAEIQSSVGFVYMILPVILNQTLNDPDCEQSWYTELRMETMFRVFNDTDSSGGSTQTPDSQKYHDSVCNNDELEDLDETIYEHVHQDHADLQQLAIEFGGNFHGLNYKRETDVEIQELLQKTEGMMMENEGKFIKRSSSMDKLINFSDEGPDETDEIPEMKNQIRLENIGSVIREIHKKSSVGFEFVILNQTHNDPDCDQSWYTENKSLIADPENPPKLSDPVISVSSDRLVTSDCVNLNHEIICDESGLRMETMFRVRNETAATPNSGYHFWGILALFIILMHQGSSERYSGYIYIHSERFEGWGSY